MFSKLALSLSVCLGGFLFLGCAGEDVPSGNPIAVEKNGSDCLNLFSTHVKKYFEGRMSQAEVAEFWDCTAHAVNEYQRLTAGEGQTDRYKPENVMRFLERHFMNDTHVPASLVYSIMEIKRVLLAGRTDSITRAELTELKDLLMLLKSVCQDLNPHARVLFLHNESASDEEITAASDAIKKAMGRVAIWLDQRRESYSFTQLETFIEQIDEFSKKEFDGSEVFAKLRKGLGVIAPAKAILISGWKQGVDGHEWAPLLESAGDAYFAYLSFNYAFQEDLNSALAREVLPHGILAATSALERGARLHRTEKIPVDEWVVLFKEVEKAKWLPEAFSAAGLTGALKWFIKRPLAQGVDSESLALDHLNVLKEQMNNWILLRRQAVSYLPGGARLSSKYEDVLLKSRPMEWDQEGRIFYPFSPATKWTSNARVRMVWPFVILNWIKESFVGAEQDELNDEEILRAAGEILPVLKGFGWLKDTENKIGTKLLRESDLFTPSSNGDALIQLHEGARYLAFVASAFRGAELWLKGAKTVCGKEPQADCVREYGADMRNDVVAAMPRLKASLSGKAAEHFVNYTRRAEETSLGTVVDGKFGTGQLLQAYMIFQYIETFLNRFDADDSGYISLNESEPAFAHFGPILESLLSVSGLPDEDLRAFFTFLMKHGDTPFTMFGGGVLWLHWKWHPESWQFESDRSTLMGILNQLSKL